MVEPAKVIKGCFQHVQPASPPFPTAGDGIRNGDENGRKTMKEDSFIRSATAPETMVAAVAANMAWKRKSVQ